MATLSSVKAYLQEHRRATLGQISLGVDADPQAVRGLLEIWHGKGRAHMATPDSGSCGKSRFGGCSCGIAHFLLEVWEWQEAGDAS